MLYSYSATCVEYVELTSELIRGGDDSVGSMSVALNVSFSVAWCGMEDPQLLRVKTLMILASAT